MPMSVTTGTIRVPTYLRGADDPYPPLNFSGRRAGRARPFPYHMQDDIDVATMPFDRERRHRAVVLNNELLEVTVLPDMNGRVYSVRDLRSGRELFYRNNVVKPALVGLRGAWLSGGIEFNFPTRGHSVSTVSPVFFDTEEHPDDVAVTVGDIDLATRLRWRVRIALRRERAAVDIATTFTNPTPLRERLYYWQNAAVPATEDLRFICRCDWTVGTESRPFPMRDGRDLSLHVSNRGPMDHFGYRSHRDFFGAYYPNTQCGTYHVAPRWQAPGQKYFTWGTQEDSSIWEGFLTDTDGQYVEIQSGLLEAQFVLGWIAPAETIRTAECWFGTEQMAELTWANDRLAAAVCQSGGDARLELFSLDAAGPCTAVVRTATDTFERATELRPGALASVLLPGLDAFEFSLYERGGALLLQERWPGGGPAGLDPQRPRQAPVQWAMQAREKPDLRKVEELLKFHHWAPAADLLEAMREQLAPVRRQLLTAELALKTDAARRAYDAAREAALLDPADAEAHALATTAAGRLLRTTGEARWYYAIWDHCLVSRLDNRFRAAALQCLAEAEIVQGNLLQALTLLDQLADTHPDLLVCHLLLGGVRRRCGMAGSAVAGGGPDWLFPEAWCAERLDKAPDPGSLRLPGFGDDLAASAAHRVRLVLDALVVYWRVGWLDDAERLLDALAEGEAADGNHPMLHALRSEARAAAGDTAGARAAAQAAAAAPVAWVLPCRWEEAVLLRRAAARLDEQCRGAIPYLLAVWDAEHHRVEQAVPVFEQCLQSERDDIRALAAKALADWADSVDHDCSRASDFLRVLLSTRPGERRALLQLDDCLYALHRVGERCALWAQIPSALKERGDVTYRLARCAFDDGRAEEAVQLLCSRRFSVYEGGTSVRRLYVDALLVAAMTQWETGDRDLAARRCRDVFEYPKNLGAASYLGEHSRLARFLLGLFAERVGDTAAARRWWQDVLERSGSTTTYAIGDEDAVARLRADERLAVVLAAARLNDRRPEPTAAEATDSVAAAVAAVYGALAAGSEGASELAAEMQERYPCDPRLRILAGMARLLAA